MTRYIKKNYIKVSKLIFYVIRDKTKTQYINVLNNIMYPKKSP